MSLNLDKLYDSNVLSNDDDGDHHHHHYTKRATRSRFFQILSICLQSILIILMILITIWFLVSKSNTNLSISLKSLHLKQTIRNNGERKKSSPQNIYFDDDDDVDNDEVYNLPGLEFKQNFRHFSGYLMGSNETFLHYWFFESQNDPDTDPIVVWLNGGPGCSSLIGALTENGPFLITKHRRLSQNPFGWNIRASLLYLESPAGVGFSYNLHQEYRTNDTDTARKNANALEHFFEKFPHLKSNDLYISGESYGGIYVPMLTKFLIEKKSKSNVKGFIIGNGLFDHHFDLISKPQYYYYHGLIDLDQWDRWRNACCRNQIEPICNFNINLRNDCFESIKTILTFDRNKFSSNSIPINLNRYNIYANCKQTVPFNNCFDLENLEAYLNQESVQKVLHVQDRILHHQQWSSCNKDVHSSYSNEILSVEPFIHFLLKRGVRGLIYSGDIDIVCNFIGTEWFVHSLNLSSKSDYSPWIFSGQIGGFIKHYENLSFATVRGAGHMVPSDRPGAAQQLFHNFLDGFDLN
ncbi:Lysosomal protective protein [Sarcoptes scabiei]|uniref:Carboxypeptidase n=1 Tax=Sarcoptes scabiei TaxID=52283 RepID=A0A834RHT3_SARSC|nr:Lysosomal protective protein [Sarcoptes scabiei]